MTPQGALEKVSPVRDRGRGEQNRGVVGAGEGVAPVTQPTDTAGEATRMDDGRRA